MQALYVTNVVAERKGNYYVLTYENAGRMTAVKMSRALAEHTVKDLQALIDRDTGSQ